MRTEQIGPATIVLGDWRDIDMPPAEVLVSDPPYGQRLKTNISRQRVGNGRFTASGARNFPKQQAYPTGLHGDDAEFDPVPILDLAPRVLIWGAHKFGHRLPFGRYIAWDKMPNGKVRTQGDGELAWTNHQPKAPLRIFRHLWDGLSVASGYETRDERTGAPAAKRTHPTQKPVDLMIWCLGQIDAPEGGLVLDPYMGSGSTGIACLLTNRRFFGAEVEPVYFDSACRRLEHALKVRESRRDMFDRVSLAA